jgi:MTH538 TIR-like domain (DUF1863)
LARRIFHSFRHDYDYWRVQTLRNIGAIEGQRLLTPNDWEKVKKKGDRAIREWIDEQMHGKSCVVVLIGSATAGRRWVNYEMKTGWAAGKGVVGIHIHGLKDGNQNQAPKGADPLGRVEVDTRYGKRKLSLVAKTYDPPRITSNAVYGYIATNIEAWIEQAIRIRKSY